MNRVQLEFDLYIAPDGLEYQFNNKIDKFIYPVSGYGMPGIRYVTQRGPYQDGVTMLDYFLEPRIVQLRHRRNATSRTGQWDVRDNVLDVLRPNRQVINTLEPGTLRKIMPDGTKRDLSVIILAGPTFDPSVRDWDEWAIDDIIRFVAHDPVFFDPTGVSTPFVFSTFDELEFPILFDDDGIAFFLSTIDETKPFTYTGSWLSYPTIDIVGPMSNPIITNTTTDEKIELTYTIAEGETVTITTEYGNKTVTNGDGDNLIGTLTTDSDLATFHLAPAPEASDGINWIRARGASADDELTKIVIEYYTRFIGI